MFRHFRCWALKGVFERVFQELSTDADFEDVMIDGTIVRLHQHGAGAKAGRAAKRPAARGVVQAPTMSVRVDALISLVRFVLLPDQLHALIGVSPLLSSMSSLRR